MAISSAPNFRPAVPASAGGGPSSIDDGEARPTGHARVRAEPALTFDDVLLLPAHSVVHPRDVSTRSRFTRGITLNVPFASAAMVCKVKHWFGGATKGKGQNWAS